MNIGAIIDKYEDEMDEYEWWGEHYDMEDDSEFEYTLNYEEEE